MAGNLAGGLLLLILSPRGALTVDAVSFAAAALLLRLGTKKRPRRVAANDLPVLRDSLTGLRRILGRPSLRRLLLFGWLLPACTAAPEALAAPYVHEIGRQAGAVGLYLAGLPAGTALADLVVARFLSLRRQLRLVLAGALLTCLPLLCFATRPGLPLAVTLLFLAGLGGAYMPGYDQRLLAESTEALRGRALATAQRRADVRAGSRLHLLGPRRRAHRAALRDPHRRCGRAPGDRRLATASRPRRLSRHPAPADRRRLCRITLMRVMPSDRGMPEALVAGLVFAGK